ncbi:MAG: hypothetical protein H6970_13595 [Gammaproteobacteria bacterium]|nr:hypothetical protein [Gammaproteobacteria bacterium]
MAQPRILIIEFYGYAFRASVNGAGPEDGFTPAEADGWFPHFIEYQEDAEGRFVYLDQPQCAHLRGVKNNIEWMRAHPRPHFAEVYPVARIDEEWPAGEVSTVKTLEHVTLLETLEALAEILQARDAQRNK